MHHWPGCWLSRVTQEPDTWKSGSENFLEEKLIYFLFGCEAAGENSCDFVKKQQKEEEEKKVFGHLIAFVIYCIPFKPTHWHLAAMLLMDCCVRLRIWMFLSSLSVHWSSPEMTMIPAAIVHTGCTFNKSAWRLMTANTPSLHARRTSLFTLTRTQTDTWGPGSCEAAVPVG